MNKEIRKYSDISYTYIHVSIMLVDEEKRELILKAAQASSEEYVKKPPLRIDRSLIGRVVRAGKMVMVPDVASDPDYQYPELAKKEGLQSLVSLPLVAKDQVLGVINCYTCFGIELTINNIAALYYKTISG